MPDFLSMGLSEVMVKKLNEYGIVKPTPIQEKAIPFVIDGKDVIAQAQTGTGKTLAFILPILEKLDLEAQHVQALVVTPTRELALQITAEFEKMLKDIDDIDVLAVYGGQDVEKQLKKLKKKVQIVVGTPGRLLDHIRRKTIDLSEINSLVLDEADQMLHIGFLDEVEEIIKVTPASRQTLLFSATIPAEVRKLARKHMHDLEYIQIEKIQGPAQTVKQIAIHTIDRAKQATLIELIETHRPYLAVIFCRTKRRVTKLFGALRNHGFKCDELHGDLSQAKREQVMKRFRDAEIQLLIATDVAARGLDVEGVTHVYNYDIPLDSESYIHRIGRTGRAGMTGLSVTLYSSDDRSILDLIEKELNITINKQNIGNMKKEDRGTREINNQPSSKPKPKPKATHDKKYVYSGKSTDKPKRKFENQNKETKFKSRNSSKKNKISNKRTHNSKNK
jgi:ATP-dependent RNA helicase DeaD